MAPPPPSRRCGANGPGLVRLSALRCRRRARPCPRRHPRNDPHQHRRPRPTRRPAPAVWRPARRLQRQPRPQLANRPGYWQLEYLHDDMPHALALAGLVIGRAGATTLAELATLELPAVLVPLPASVSRGDQVPSARSWTSRGPGPLLDGRLGSAHHR
ncbi:glycosyltransferase [Streptomyces sp. AC602_WCS936]|uniref:glycosyltransferase n=1 Tax=Streptomyces sp. AC602_WCS936 TaxID=2823685 RepID=UPI0035AF5A2D